MSSGMQGALRTGRGKAAFAAAIAAAAAVAAVASLTVGPMDIGFLDALDIFISNLVGIPSGYPEVFDTVVWDIRAPRVLASALVGAALAASGCAYQGIFRNPLVEPYILGVSSGAAFGAALCIVTGVTLVSFQATAVAFAFAAVALTYFAATVRGTTRLLSLVLTGLIVGALFTAGLSYLKIVALPGQLQEITFWLMGGFYMVRWDNSAPLLAVPVLLLGLCLMSGRLNLLALGDDVAESSGVDVGRAKVLAIAMATAATAVSVSMVGIISWVGLLVPHVCRLAIGPDHRHLMPSAVFFGALFMIVCDTAARSLFLWEVPVSILTSAVMAPMLIAIVRRNGAAYFGGRMRAEGIFFTYPGRREPTLKGATFDTGPGGVTGLFGPNGSGKTTLLKCLAGLRRPQAGRALLDDGTDVSALDVRRRSELISYVPQDLPLDMPFTVREVVAMGLQGYASALFASEGDVERTEETVRAFGLEGIADERFTELSGGQRQLVSIARAVNQRAGHMLLDEPASNLDFSNAHGIWRRLRSLSGQGIAVVVSSHEPNHILRYCDRAVLVDRGEVVGAGAPEDVLDESRLEAMFGMPVCRERAGGAWQVMPGDRRGLPRGPHPGRGRGGAVRRRPAPRRPRIRDGGHERGHGARADGGRRGALPRARILRRSAGGPWEGREEDARPGAARAVPADMD